ncbi:MAG: hypothetical protein R2911_44950 [Caldilineaceae bacterium]
MSLQLLWYMLAAFIVGFTLSTLWEWFYFRGRRLQWRDERVHQLTEELDSTRAQLERYRAQASGVATAATYASMPVTPIDTEFQSSAARLESEQPDPIETAMRFARRDTRPRPVIDEPEPDWPADEASLPFEPEENVPPGARFIAPAEDVEDHAQTATQPARMAEPAPPAERLPRTITATPQTHAELDELIARLEELERKAAAKSERADDTEFSANIERIAAPASRRTDQLAAAATQIEPGKDSTPIESTPIDSTTSTAAAQSAPPAPTPQPVAAPSSRPDDLQAITGIGKTYANRLREGGIHTWRQMAESDEDKLRALTKAPRVSNVANWITQAAELMRQHGQTGADDQTT